MMTLLNTLGRLPTIAALLCLFWLPASGVQARAAEPAIMSVSVPANATYGVGDNLYFTVIFDQNVTLTGTPQLGLTIGTTARTATYDSKTGNALTFRYVVLAGDVDSDGITLDPSLTLNGSTIRNGASLDAVLTLNGVGSTTGVLVGGPPPTVPTLTEWAMILLALALGGLAAFRLQARRREAL